MTIMPLPKMIFSSEGWLDLERMRWPLPNFLAYLVLPLSLLPPAMLYHAGTRYGDLFVAGFGSKPWLTIAVLFFLTEIITVLIMGAMIEQVARSHGLVLGRSKALLLASIAPIPMWLSSLCLLIPNLALDVGLALSALAAGCSLLYHGICAFGHTREDVSASAITQTVMGAGLVCWVLLLGLIVAI